MALLESVKVAAIILNVKSLNEARFYSTYKIKVRVAYHVIYVNCYSSNSKIKLNLVVNANTIQRMSTSSCIITKTTTLLVQFTGFIINRGVTAASRKAWPKKPLVAS